MQIHLAGVVVLYHPDESVLQNIQSYLSDLDKLYVIDNSENPEQGGLIEQIKALPHVQYKALGENLGISYALNYAAEQCQGLRYLLTMDQDSSFEPGDVARYKKKIGERMEQNIAVFAVREEGARKNIEPDRYVKRVITSGSVIDLSIMRKIGDFDEELFIDSVDFEYCYRAASNGYKILRFGDIVLNHHLGELQVCKRFGKERVLHVHNAIRRYYITRNNIYLLKKYPRRNFSKFKGIFKSLWRIILYEDNKGDKLIAWGYGFLDGGCGNMGKCKRKF